MKKEEIYVVIDSEEKRQKAVHILNDAGEPIWDYEIAMKITNKRGFLLITSDNDWMLGDEEDSNGRAQITLDQLEQLLKPELTFPREMLVWDNDGGHKNQSTVIGKVKQFWVDVSGDTYLNAEDLPTFETEVQKLAEQFGVKVKSLEYEN